MNNTNSKSKTTLASGGGGFGAHLQKSNRNKISPFKADKNLLTNEMSKIVKDETRQTFGSFIDNLPQINKKPIRGTKSPQPPAVSA